MRLGWQVMRGLLGQVVDLARVRRALWIAGAVAAAVLGALVALHLVNGWAGTGSLRPGLVVAAVTASVFLLVYACCPTAREVGPELRINGRQVRPNTALAVRWEVRPYLDRVRRPVHPEHREAILNDVPLLQRGLVRRLTRLAPLLLAVAIGAAVVLTTGRAQVFAVLWPFVYLFTLPDMVLRIGRSERARRDALATPPAAPEQRPQWRRDPSGSKLGLPGE